MSDPSQPSYYLKKFLGKVKLSAVLSCPPTFNLKANSLLNFTQSEDII